MPRNGNGTYSLPQAPFVAGTTISSAAVNSDFNDIATALTGSLPRNGEAGMSGQLKLADGGTATPSMTFTNDANTGFFRPANDQIGVVIAGTQTGYFADDGYHGVVTNVGITVGSVLDYAGSAAPALWLLCFGQNVSRTTYSALFAVITTTFGAGDGATTFGLPDLRGRVMAGKDNMGGSAASRLTTAIFGSDPTVIGDSGGGQSTTMNQNQLPNVAPSFTGINDPVTVITNRNDVAIGGVITGLNNGIFAINTNSTTSAVTSTGNFTPRGTVSSINGNVTQQPLSNVQPSMIMNKIIYAGA